MDKHEPSSRLNSCLFSDNVRDMCLNNCQCRKKKKTLDLSVEPKIASSVLYHFALGLTYQYSDVINIKRVKFMKFQKALSCHIL